MVFGSGRRFPGRVRDRRDRSGAARSDDRLSLSGRKVSLLFGGATSTQMVSIQFWDDPGGSNDPGAPIGLPFDVSLTGADDVLHEVTLGDDVS